MPSHHHNINYNSTLDKGGIWGTNSYTGGNYGNPLYGDGQYA